MALRPWIPLRVEVRLRLARLERLAVISALVDLTEVAVLEAAPTAFNARPWGVTAPATAPIAPAGPLSTMTTSRVRPPPTSRMPEPMYMTLAKIIPIGLTEVAATLAGNWVIWHQAAAKPVRPAQGSDLDVEEPPGEEARKLVVGGVGPPSQLVPEPQVPSCWVILGSKLSQLAVGTLWRRAARMPG